MLIDRISYVERGPSLGVRTLRDFEFGGVFTRKLDGAACIAVKPMRSLRMRQIELIDVQHVEMRGELFELDLGNCDLDDASAQLAAFIDRGASRNALIEGGRGLRWTNSVGVVSSFVRQRLSTATQRFRSAA